MEVLLIKLGRRSSPPVVGRLVKSPKRGDVVVIEFQDGLHEYVTTPVQRVLRLAPGGIYYIQTANSRYRLEVRESQTVIFDNSLAQ